MSKPEKSKKALSDQVAETAAVKYQEGAVAVPKTDLAGWELPSLSARDIVIPKIMAMQPMSQLVVNGDAKFGEFRDSTNSKVMGSDKSPMEFIPFFLEKAWIIFEEKNGELKFKRTLPITPQNEAWEYEEIVDGVKTRRDRTMNYYVLVPSEVAKGEAIPYIISFRRSSARAGQKLATTMYMKNIKAGKNPAAMVMELLGTKTQNDKGTFIVLDVREKRAATVGEQNEAFDWIQTIRSGAAKADHSDLVEEAAQSSALSQGFGKF